MMVLKRLSVAALLASSLVAATPAFAQRMPDTGWYVGGSLGQSEVDDYCAGLAGCDDNDTAWKVFGGYNINRNFAIEFGYTDLGEVSGNLGIFGSTSAEASAFEVVGIASAPIANQFSVFGKIGLYRADVDVSGSGIFDSGSDTNTDLTFGVGVRYDFDRNFGVRAEWQRYSDVGGGDIGEADIDVLSIGVIYRF